MSAPYPSTPSRRSSLKARVIRLRHFRGQDDRRGRFRARLVARAQCTDL